MISYAGPDSQRIDQNYKLDWGISLVSDKEIIYGSIDGRGSGRQSSELKFVVNRNLGSAEIEDQISATKLVKSTKNNKTSIKIISVIKCLAIFYYKYIDS